MDLKQFELTLLHTLEIQIRMTALNKEILILGNQNPRDTILLSLLTLVPFNTDTIDLIDRLIKNEYFHRIETKCIEAFGLSYATLLREYADTIKDTFEAIGDAMDEIKDSVVDTYVDTSSFFEHSGKLS